MFAGEVEVGGGVGGNEVLAAEPGEEAADAAEAGDLGVDDEGFIAAWGAVMVKEMLIGGEVGAGDVFDLGVFFFLRPGAELFQRPEVGIGRCVRVGACCEALQEVVDVGIEALGSIGDGWAGTAFAASAHGGDVRKSCGSGHGGDVGQSQRFAMGNAAQAGTQGENYL